MFAVAVVLCGFRNVLYCHTIKSVGTRFLERVGRLPYASGAEWQGWVGLELQDQTYLPCIGTLFYLPRHNGAPRFAPRRCQDNLMCVLFIGHFFELLLLRLVDQTAL